MFGRFEGTEGGCWDELFEEVFGDGDKGEFGEEKEGEDVGWLR